MQLILGTGKAITRTVLRGGQFRAYLPAPGMCTHTHYIGLHPRTPHFRLRITLAFLLCDLVIMPVAGRWRCKTPMPNAFSIPDSDNRNFWAEMFDLTHEDAVIIQFERGPQRFDVLISVESYRVNIDQMESAVRRIGIDGERKVELGSTTSVKLGAEIMDS